MFSIVAPIVIALMRGVFGIVQAVTGVTIESVNGKLTFKAPASLNPAFSWVSGAVELMYLTSSAGNAVMSWKDASGNEYLNTTVASGTPGKAVLWSGGIWGWSNNATAAWQTLDAGLRRVAAGVVGAVSDQAATAGWFQNSAGYKRLTANVTENAAALANLTDLTVTLIAGRKYTGRMVLKVTDSTVAEGVKLDFNGGTATMTSFAAGAGVLAGGTNVLVNAVSSALATAINWSTITGETWVTVEISLVCNAGGTFIPRAAQNSHATGTLTTALGSYLHLDDSAN